MTRIVSTTDVLGGEPRIADRRIGVLDVYDLVAAGHSPVDVADQFDATLAEVHAALTYYYEHPEQMRTLRREREETKRTLASEALAPPHTA